MNEKVTTGDLIQQMKNELQKQMKGRKGFRLDSRTRFMTFLVNSIITLAK